MCAYYPIMCQSYWLSHQISPQPATILHLGGNPSREFPSLPTSRGLMWEPTAKMEETMPIDVHCLWESFWENMASWQHKNPGVPCSNVASQISMGAHGFNVLAISCNHVIFACFAPDPLASVSVSLTTLRFSHLQFTTQLPVVPHKVVAEVSKKVNL